MTTGSIQDRRQLAQEKLAAMTSQLRPERKTMMKEQKELLETILDLVSRKTEGRYWDFKIRHHENKAELIHDVLCLANAEHKGRRYLIFGVEDKSYELRSVAGSTGRKSQADMAGLFRDNASKFFQFRTGPVQSRFICRNPVLELLIQRRASNASR